MTRKLVFAIAVLSAVLVASCGKDDGKKGGKTSGQGGQTAAEVPLIGTAEAADYDVFGLGTFPIGMWVAPPASFMSKARLQEMKESGINVMNEPDPGDAAYMIRQLDWCKEVGLKMMGYYGGNRNIIEKAATDKDYAPFDNLIQDVYSQYADHEACWGEHFFDEPSKDQIAALSVLGQKYRAAFPTKQIYVNLFPVHASNAQLGTTSYEDYLDTWMAVPGLTSVSFDIYPFMPDALVREDFFYNLDIVREKSRAKKMPYWVFVQSGAWKNRRLPTEEELRWNVATSYVFGSKGVQYFIYWFPSDDFTAYMIDRDGNKTEMYNYVKRINEDFAFIGSALLQCHAEGVIQHAEKKLEVFKTLTKFGPLLTVYGSPVNVGCFLSTDGHYKYLVNNHMPGQGATSARLEFAPNVKKVRVTTSAGASEKAPTFGLIDLTLSDGGQPVLIEVLTD